MKKKLLKFAGAAVVMGLIGAPLAYAAKKGVGAACKNDGDCQSGFCKPSPKHKKGYTGTCQKQ